MTTRDEVYRKYGETSEAAQLLETELGTVLLVARVKDCDLIANPNISLSRKIVVGINRMTLGQLLHKLFQDFDLSFDETLLESALAARNRLAHGFFRSHNMRIHSDDGRTMMYSDLESMHETIFTAYKSVLRLSGIDLDAISMTDSKIPSKHLSI